MATGEQPSLEPQDRNGLKEPRDARVDQAYVALGRETPPAAVGGIVRKIALEALESEVVDDTGILAMEKPARPRWLIPAAAAGVAALLLAAVLFLTRESPETPAAVQSTPAARAPAAANRPAAAVEEEASTDDEPELPPPPPVMDATAMGDLERVIPLIPDHPDAAAASGGGPADVALQEVLHLYDGGDFGGAAAALAGFRQRFPLHPVSELLDASAETAILDEDGDVALDDEEAVGSLLDAAVDSLP